MSEKISLAGDLGGGKSTVSAILTDKLGAEYYYTGAIVRSVAEKYGMTVGELNVYMETHPEIDNEIDDGLRALTALDRTMIIDSRMAWHFVGGTFRVYLSTDIETSAFRIMNANRRGEHAKTLEDTITETRARRTSEKKRYLQLYGVDIKDLMNYDLIVDTTYALPDKIAECILDAYEIWCADKSYRAAFISPERINYPDDATDAQLISELSDLIELGEKIPEVVLAERDGEFYAVDGIPSALAYALAGKQFVPARLTSYTSELDGINFVKMKNSL